MNSLEKSLSESGSVAEHQIAGGGGPEQMHDIAYSVNVFDGATLGTVQAVFRWVDPFGISRSHTTSAVSVIGTPILQGQIAVWLGGSEALTLELVAASIVGTLEYGYNVGGDMYYC